MAAVISAKAGRDTVREAELARKMRIRPSLTIERRFSVAALEFPPENSPAISPAEKAWGNGGTEPHFDIHNHGEGPALNIVVSFAVDDPDGEMIVPDMFLNAGGDQNSISLDGERGDWRLKFRRGAQGAYALPIAAHATVTLPLIRPGQGKFVRLPASIMALMAVRGMQRTQGQQLGRDECGQYDLAMRYEYLDVEGGKHSGEVRQSMQPYAARVRSMSDEVLRTILHTTFSDKVETISRA